MDWEAIDRYRQHRPDVTLMDLQMPRMDGVAATNAIRAEFPEARIVMLTTYRGDVQALRALKAGAVGYLLKSLIRTELLQAIRSVHLGRRQIPPDIAAGLAEHAGEDALSDRELDVLRRVAAGNSQSSGCNAAIGIGRHGQGPHEKHLVEIGRQRPHPRRRDRHQARHHRRVTGRSAPTCSIFGRSITRKSK